MTSARFGFVVLLAALLVGSACGGDEPSPDGGGGDGAVGDPEICAYAGNDPINGADPTGLFVDTLLDAVAIGGCAFAILRDNVFGSCGNFTANAQRCAMAAAAFVVPFVAYGALRATGRLGRRVARRAADPPCGGGVCPCFVAGTLVATGIVAGVAPAEALTHQSIEALEVGDRVITAATLRDGEDDTFDTAVTAAWQVIDLELAGDDETGKRKVVALTVLRPPGWLDAEDPDGDGAFPLHLPELRLRGLAHVVHVRGPPKIAEGPGRVVLATVEHVADDVVALTLVAEDYAAADVPSVLRGTPNHPFFSLTRSDWVAAGALAIGEVVETATGSQVLVGRETIAGAHRVYNLTVERDAEYLVGSVGARVHNTYPRGGASRGRARNRVPDRVRGRPTTEQQALIDMAAADSRRVPRGQGPISQADADAYVDLADQVGVPVRARPSDLSGAHGYGPVQPGPGASHIHVNGEHVPVPPGYTPPSGSSVIR